MSRGSLAICCGLMVYGAVVVVGNVEVRLREMGGATPRRRVVGDACREMARPAVLVVSMLILVFLSLLTVQGVAGKTFRPLAQAAVLVLVGSLIFTVILVPILSSFLLHSSHRYGRTGLARMPLVQRFVTVVHPALSAVVEFYNRRRWIAIVLVVVFLVSSIAIFPQLGAEFAPRLNEGTIVIQLTMAPSISLQESIKTTRIVEKRLLRIPEVREVIGRIGEEQVGEHPSSVNEAEIWLLLAPEAQWRGAMTQAELEEVIRQELGHVPGVMINVGQPITLAVDHLREGIQSQLAIQLYGEDLDVVATTAAEIVAVLRAVPGAVDVRMDRVSGTPQLSIELDRGAIARYGLQVSDVQRVIRAAFGGQQVGEIIRGDQRIAVKVRFDTVGDRAQAGIGTITIQSPDGIHVPLAELAEFEEVVGRRQITRENHQRFIRVQCNAVGRDIGSFVTDAQHMIEDRVDLPPDHLLVWGGQFRLLQEANRNLGVVVPVTLLLLTLLVFGAVRSWWDSLLVLLNIPLALAGGAYGLWMTGQHLCVPAIVGFLILSGIALGNGVVLSAVRHRQSSDDGDFQPVATGQLCRLARPVWIAVAAVALGLLPVMVSQGSGSEILRPLATVIFGGLLGWTVLTLLMLPEWTRWVANRS
jgi:cobalt-zinc-cadmium resistance protein CzcA